MFFFRILFIHWKRALPSAQGGSKRWLHTFCGGWSGGAKVLCILHHWGVQLILAYSWARSAILVVGKDRGECFYFFCFFTFIPVLLSSLSLSFISSTLSSTLSSISFLPFSGRRHKMTLKGWRVVKPQHNQNIHSVRWDLRMVFWWIFFIISQLNRVPSWRERHFWWIPAVCLHREIRKILIV